LIAEILAAEGYWVRPSVKVALTKAAKVKIGRPSAPRWEIDVIAYHAPENKVLAVECKSYLDSYGVDLADLKGGRLAGRYKLFTEPKTRRVVLQQLSRDLVGSGLCARRPRIQLALAAGKVRSHQDELQAFFRKKGWVLFDPEWIRSRLREASGGKYTDSVASMVAKLLLRT
jgi:hypothetical protein